MPDFTIRQGDTKPVLNDTLTYSDGTTVDLTGSTVNFVMRGLTATAAVVNKAATVTSVTAPATVSYTFTADDTTSTGMFEGYWKVTGGQADGMTFPTVGGLSIQVAENLTTAGGARLLALSEVKEYLNLPASNRAQDNELLRFIDGIAPVVEFITGPILQHQYFEVYDGGVSEIIARHRPLLEVEMVSEYRGPIRYDLQQVPTPDLGTIYSYVWYPDGRIIRRTVGGGITPFPGGKAQVFVTYTAGYTQVPHNVRMGALELLRVNYQQTQQAGRSRLGESGFGGGDELEPGGPMLGFFVPNRVRELLAPSRRFPSLA